jgi:4-hydroxythreonine-4-phosphate dehydrogenase
MKPTVLVFAGDPAGIGSEVVVKLLADEEARAAAHIIVVGSRPLLAGAMQFAGASPRMQDGEAVRGSADRTIQLAAWPRLEEEAFRLGTVTAESGAFMLDGLAFGLKLCSSGIADAMCVAPLTKAAMRAGGMKHPDEINYFREVLDFRGKTVEFNVNEHLWTSRVTSHVPLKDVSGLLTVEKIVDGVKLLTEGLRAANCPEPRIGVCGLNPHNGEGGAFGTEEIDIIAPAVQRACAEGYPCVGPLPSDTAFVRAIRKDDGLDGILTMYHDQGQIAMKLLSFGRGVTVHYGLPIPITTTSHGSAYDIVNKGVATPEAMKNAFLMAARMGETRRSG